MLQRPSSVISERIRDGVHRDLSPNQSVVQGKVGGAFFLGVLISLSVCNQFGLGLTPWSEIVQMKLMHAGNVVCMLACGFLFAMFPILALRILSNSMQFRCIVRYHSRTILTWLAMSAFYLMFMSGFQTEDVELAIWIASALATTWLGARFVDWMAQVLAGMEKYAESH